MPMRNPVYLDQEILLNAADYHGIDYAVETQVKEKGTTSADGEGSLSVPGVGGKVRRGKATELETSYAMPAKPLRVMNDVIDAAQSQELLRHIEDGTRGITKGDLVEMEGHLELSAASEVGNIMGRFLPAVAAGGGELQPAAQAKLMAEMVASSPATSRQLFELELDDDAGVRVFLAVDPAHFFRNNTLEDLEGEVTVFGTVERIVPEGAQISTERWLLPDMDRSMRRLFKKQGLEKMLEGLEAMVSVDTSQAKSIEGPAVEIRPIAIY